MNDNVTRSLEEVVSILDTCSQEAFVRATDQSLGKVAEITLKAVFGAVTSGLSGPCGPFVSKFAQVFLEALFHTQHNLQEIEGAVSALVREPLMTGMEQLKLGLKTAPSSQEATGYRLGRLQMALSSLDRARSLALQRELLFEVAFVDLLRGFCALELPGGMSEATIHIDSFLKWACGQLAHLPSITAKEEEIKEWDWAHATVGIPDGMLGVRMVALEKIEGLRAEIDRLSRQKQKIQGLLANSTKTLLQKCEEIQDLLAEVRQLTAEKERLLSIVSHVFLLITAIEKTSSNAD